MPVTVGVDWGSTGWIRAVRDPEDGWSIDYHPSMVSLWRDRRDAQSILVGIPIGLPGTGRRACDTAAKDVPADRRRSVFSTPPRATLGVTSYADAKRETEAVTAGSLTTQAWIFSPGFGNSTPS